jgi:hypothetical protein
MTKEEAIKVVGQPTSVDANDEIEYWNYIVVEKLDSDTIQVASPHDIPRYVPPEDSFFNSGPGMTPIIFNRTRRYRIGGLRTARFSLLFSENRLVSVGPIVPRSKQQFQDNGFVQIKSVSPSSASPDKSTEFKFKIAYRECKASSGVIQLGFNTESPDVCRTALTETVNYGPGTLELSVTVTPRDWGKAKHFTAMVVLRDGIESNLGEALNHDVLEIPLTK